MKILNLFLPLLGFGILACGSREVKPVDLYPEDNCSHCKMAISEKIFAGEIVKENGEVFKFDDLGCLRAMMKNEEVAEGAHLFFQVMVGDEWANGGDATLVKATVIRTPMGSGMIAFAERKNAEDFIRQHGGELTSLEDFLKGVSFHE